MDSVGNDMCVKREQHFLPFPGYLNKVVKTIVVKQILFNCFSQDCQL